MAEELLRVEALTKYFAVRRGFLQRTIGFIRAIDGVDLSLRAGETLGIVGESGCGKSTLGRTILRLLEPTSGRILFEGRDISSLSQRRVKGIRSKMQMIFQDPVGSLDPRMKVGSIVGEGLAVNGIYNRVERDRLIRSTLELVGLPANSVDSYPHEFSGGQRQRIGIARALVLHPKLIVADEPVSALDVSIQSQVLNLLVDLKRTLNLTYIFIAHNLAVVAYISDRIAVMYLGQIVELSSSGDLYARPLHPYTQSLLAAIPDTRRGKRDPSSLIVGEVPSPFNPPSGCHFRTRCALARALGTENTLCARERPVLKEWLPGRFGACHFADRAASSIPSQTHNGGPTQPISS